MEALKEKWHNLNPKAKIIILVGGAVAVIYFLHRSGTPSVATTTTQTGATVADPNASTLPSPTQLPDVGSGGSSTSGSGDTNAGNPYPAYPAGPPPANVPAPVASAPLDPGIPLNGPVDSPSAPAPDPIYSTPTNPTAPTYPTTGPGDAYIPPAPVYPPAVQPPPIYSPSPYQAAAGAGLVASLPSVWNFPSTPHTLPDPSPSVAQQPGYNPFAAGNPAYSWYEPTLSGMPQAIAPAQTLLQKAPTLALSPGSTFSLAPTAPAPAPIVYAGGASKSGAKMA